VKWTWSRRHVHLGIFDIFLHTLTLHENSRLPIPLRDSPMLHICSATGRSRPRKQPWPLFLRTSRSPVLSCPSSQAQEQRSPTLQHLLATHPSSRKQRILLPQILAHIRLPKRHHTRRIQLPRIRRTPRTHAKPQRRIIHTQYYHALMFRAILAPPAHMRLEHIAPVQERHLTVRLDPHLVARVRRDDG
jgi:hypothetical protein